MKVWLVVRRDLPTAEVYGVYTDPELAGDALDRCKHVKGITVLEVETDAPSTPLLREWEPWVPSQDPTYLRIKDKRGKLHV